MGRLSLGACKLGFYERHSMRFFCLVFLLCYQFSTKSKQNSTRLNEITGSENLKKHDCNRLFCSSYTFAIDNLSGNRFNLNRTG